MKDLCDENCSNIQRHYMKEKYDMLFCYKQEQDKFDKLSAHLRDLTDQVQEQRRRLGDNYQLVEMTPEQRCLRKQTLLTIVQELDEQVKELRQSLGRAQASMHQMLHVECPKCQKVVTQANKMLCVFPCGCGVC